MMASYELTRHRLRACRALAKLIDLNSIPDWVWISETAFDAGEWSAPILADLQQEIETDATATVAIRFGYLPITLATAFTYYLNTETSFLWDAFRLRRNMR